MGFFYVAHPNTSFLTTFSFSVSLCTCFLSIIEGWWNRWPKQTDKDRRKWNGTVFSTSKELSYLVLDFWFLWWVMSLALNFELFWPIICVYLFDLLKIHAHYVSLLPQWDLNAGLWLFFFCWLALKLQTSRSVKGSI